MGVRVKWIFILLTGVLLVSGCIQPESIGPGLPDEEPAKTACITLCEANLKGNVDLSSGPCLSDNHPNWNVDDWVCDVAHSPRQDVDNLAENQCSSYGSVASHFVEVDENCEFIREV